MTCEIHFTWRNGYKYSDKISCISQHYYSRITRKNCIDIFHVKLCSVNSHLLHQHPRSVRQRLRERLLQELSRRLPMATRLSARRDIRSETVQIVTLRGDKDVRCINREEIISRCVIVNSLYKNKIMVPFYILLFHCCISYNVSIIYISFLLIPF